ncbi:MAG: hypothetical protein FVQ85_05080 [Planctomycetes bacterium]|nr:hypothetical protein [Planctomycetota bacterium]
MRKTILLSIVVLLVTLSSAPAETRLVPDEYATIQTAIDACADGDIVIIAPGTYTGEGNRDINYGGRAITVQSIDPNDPSIVSATIIDCQASISDRHCGFYFYRSSVGADSVIDGLTITNGFSSKGAGIFCNQKSSPKIVRCSIVGNSGRRGGGIYVYDGTPIIDRCIIMNNIVGPEYYHGEGGGIFCSSSTDLTISNCIIADNSVIGTTSENRGGGLFLSSNNVTLRNCTITGNTAQTIGGIFCYNKYANITIENCIVWGNTSSNSLQIGGNPEVSYSNIQGGFPGIGNINTNPLFVNPVAGDFHLSSSSPCIDTGDPKYLPFPSERDIDNEPRVIGLRTDMGVDEFISTTTPVIGILPNSFTFHANQGGVNPEEQLLSVYSAGYINLIWNIMYDCPWLNVEPIQGESSGEIDLVNLSVDTWELWPGEYNCELKITAVGAFNSPLRIPITLYIRPVDGILYVPSEYETIQSAINAAQNGDTIIAAPMTYSGDVNRNINFYGKAITVRSVEPNDPNIVEATVIDCEGLGRGFNFHSGEDTNSVLSGFTVANGSAFEGCAIYINSSSPLITRCAIIGNSSDKKNARGGGIYIRNGNPIISHCTVSENSIGNAETYGGGIFNDGGKPTIKNCIINFNSARKYGGGIYNNAGNLRLADCILTSNSSDYGGGMYNKNSNLILTNCTFTANSAKYSGGGMYNWGGSLKLTNCVFIRNRKFFQSIFYIGGGGGVYNNANSPIFINCNFIGNSTYGRTLGGGIYNKNATPELTNCILWGNSGKNGIDYSSQIYSDKYYKNLINYCCIHDLPSYLGGVGNINADPLFVNPAEEDFRLSAGSPCIDAGDNSAVPVSLLTDLDGKDRIVNGRVDMGVYERTNLGFLVSPQSITVPEGSTATFTVMLAMDPHGTREATVYRKSGDPDIAVESGALLIFDSSNYSQPQTVTLTAAEDEDHLSSEALFWISTSGFVVASVSATEADNEPYADILLVDADAAGANNGLKWVDAFTDLQQALSAARAIPEIDQIWVAEGIYKPDELFSDDREATFQLVNGVVIKGGYAGFGEADPDSRDINTYETILSGDLAGNDIDVSDPCDLLDELSRDENSYHVVTSSENDATTGLDGFTITGGNTNNYPYIFPDFEGGGMYIEYGDPTVTNCNFSGNSAYYGGGMFIDIGDPTVTNCTFTGNSAFDGGGMYNRYYSEPVITNCSFIMNYAKTTGGGITCIDNCRPTINNCNITANIAGSSGGGIGCFYSSPTIINCTINGNTALVSGGGISCHPGPPPPPPVPSLPSGADVISSSNIEVNLSLGDYYSSNDVVSTPTNFLFSGSAASESSDDRYSYPTLKNCIISGNSAGSYGGGMYNYVSHPTLTNCTVSSNSAGTNGGGIYNEGSNATLNNCILWADTATEGGEIYLVLCSDYWPYQSFYSTINIEYCDVNGGVTGVYVGIGCTLNWGEGNIDADPCFFSPGYWDMNGVCVEGDYHLLWDSPCIDAGDPNYVTEPNETDLDGRPRVMGRRIDMGAYESTPSIPAEAKIIPRTINLASKGNRLTCYIWLPEGYNVADIDPNSVFLEEQMKAEELSVDEQKQVGIARFNREELRGIINTGEVELTITGQLKDGTIFEATDVIRVIDEGRRKN